MGAACHSIQLSSYKHHSLAPHRTAPHASPLRACRQHHELLPREPLHAPAPSPESVPRPQPAPPGPAHRPRAAMPRCPGTALRRRQALPAPALATACGVTLLRAAWGRPGACGGGGGGALPDSSRLPSAPSNFSSSLFVSLRFLLLSNGDAWRRSSRQGINGLCCVSLLCALERLICLALSEAPGIRRARLALLQSLIDREPEDLGQTSAATLLPGEDFLPRPTYSPALPALRSGHPLQPPRCDKHERGSGPTASLLHALPHPQVLHPPTPAGPAPDPQLSCRQRSPTHRARPRPRPQPQPRGAAAGDSAPAASRPGPKMQ